MRKTRRTRRWLVAGLLLAIGGCVTDLQMQDFLRTEFARVIADAVGNDVQTVLQASS